MICLNLNFEKTFSVPHCSITYNSNQLANMEECLKLLSFFFGHLGAAETTANTCLYKHASRHAAILAFIIILSPIFTLLLPLIWSLPTLPRAEEKTQNLLMILWKLKTLISAALNYDWASSITISRCNKFQFLPRISIRNLFSCFFQFDSPARDASSSGQM